MDGRLGSSRRPPAIGDAPYQDILVGDLLGQIERHGIEPLMHTPAGQSIAYFSSKTTVAEVIKALVDEALDTFASLS